MTTIAIRKKLMTYIADADDKKVKGLFMLVEDDIKKTEKLSLSTAEFKMLEKEKEMHVKRKSKSLSWPEAKEIIRGNRKL
jgi:hypothetical protein